MSNKNYPMKTALVCLLLSSGVMAQKLPVPDSEVPSSGRNEVVCYALEDRWICTPKGSEIPAAAVERAKVRAEAKAQAELEATLDAIEPLPETSEAIIESIPTQPLVNPIYDTPTTLFTEQSPQTISPAEREQQQPIRSVENREPTTRQADYAGDNWFENHPNDWTVQIVGVANQQNLDDFISQQRLNNQDYRIVETVSNGASWWVVIYGHYPNREAAENARDNLPTNLATDAWLRPLSSLAGAN